MGHKQAIYQSRNMDCAVRVLPQYVVRGVEKRVFEGDDARFEEWVFQKDSPQRYRQLSTEPSPDGLIGVESTLLHTDTGDKFIWFDWGDGFKWNSWDGLEASDVRIIDEDVDTDVLAVCADSDCRHFARTVYRDRKLGIVECPSARMFDGVNLYIDMERARAIQMADIRVVRNAELAAKDITFIRAIEAGDTDAQATIATEKQVLRDIPQTFDLTTDNNTPKELKEKWPEELPKE